MASGHGQAIASWWRDDPPAPPAAAALLTGLSVLYRGARALHRGLYAAGLKRRRRLPIPVVSVGNVTVGGTGKTPFVAWLARELMRRDRRVLVLARGYGSSAGASHNDEGEWLERAAPGVRVVQSPDRVRAAAAALSAAPADVAILDDGFQHEPLARDLDVVLIDACDPFGNRRLLPRGPLRESLGALRRAHFVFLTRAELAGDAAVERLAAEVRALAPAARVGAVRFEIAALCRGPDREAVVVGPSSGAKPRRVVLCTGVASPRSVRAAAERIGAQVADELVFPDHHPFTRDELERSLARARELDSELWVTSKDAVKLDLLGDPRRYVVLEQEVVVEDSGRELLQAFERLGRLRSASSS